MTSITALVLTSCEEWDIAVTTLLSITSLNSDETCK